MKFCIDCGRPLREPENDFCEGCRKNRFSDIESSINASVEKSPPKKKSKKPARFFAYFVLLIISTALAFGLAAGATMVTHSKNKAINDFETAVKQNNEQYLKGNVKFVGIDTTQKDVFLPLFEYFSDEKNQLALKNYLLTGEGEEFSCFSIVEGELSLGFKSYKMVVSEAVFVISGSEPSPIVWVNDGERAFDLFFDHIEIRGLMPGTNTLYLELPSVSLVRYDNEEFHLISKKSGNLSMSSEELTPTEPQPTEPVEQPPEAPAQDGPLFRNNDHLFDTIADALSTYYKSYLEVMSTEDITKLALYTDKTEKIATERMSGANKGSIFKYVSMSSDKSTIELTNDDDFIYASVITQNKFESADKKTPDSFKQSQNTVKFTLKMPINSKVPDWKVDDQQTVEGVTLGSDLLER